MFMQTDKSKLLLLQILKLTNLYNGPQLETVEKYTLVVILTILYLFDWNSSLTVLCSC